jgi:hypothetical protein
MCIYIAKGIAQLKHLYTDVLVSYVARSLLSYPYESRSSCKTCGYTHLSQGSTVWTMKQCLKTSTKSNFCFDQHIESTQSISVLIHTNLMYLFHKNSLTEQAGSDHNIMHQCVRQRTLSEICNLIQAPQKNESVTTHTHKHEM